MLALSKGSLSQYQNLLSSSRDVKSSYQAFSKAEGAYIRAGAIGEFEQGDVSSSVDTYLANATLLNYNNLACLTSQNINVEQSGLVDINLPYGNFDSYSRYSNKKYRETSHRKPTYSTKYNILMTSLFDRNTKTNEVKGLLGHYIDINNPQANKIQKAIDNAYDGDYILVATGIYNESLVIKKSLGIIGAGTSGTYGTIIDNQGRGSVVEVLGTDNKVFLSSLVITAGNAKQGGGIYNTANLVLKDYKIINNRAEKGGGIYNNNSLTLMDGVITENSAPLGGGIYNEPLEYFTSQGHVYLEGGKIFKNTAGQGAGIYNNHGDIHLDSGDISRNHAYANYGGGGLHTYYRLSKGIHGNESIVHDNTAYEHDTYDYDFYTTIESNIVNEWGPF